ncbi:MAG: hypothetical protein QME42_04085 [bacterium]|nr:hypothetical protein [bacterium]
MRVVSNAGPLIALGKLGQLGLLVKLYDYVLIPPKVELEVVTNGINLGCHDAYATKILIDKGIIEVKKIASAKISNWINMGIDEGEAETIELALAEGADLVLIDNWHAREAARKVNLKIKGSVGIIVEAYRRRYLTMDEFELLIKEIENRPELWISDEICDYILRQVEKEKRKDNF